jgi:ammonium transporter, Amt family
MSCSDLTVACGSCTLDQTTALGAIFTTAQLEQLCTTVIKPGVDAYAAASAVTASVTGLTEGLNCLYLVLCAALVFVMHGGFAMLCAGAIRSKSTMNILLQTILDACVSAIAFYICGYAFAYGGYWYNNEPGLDKKNNFIGNAMFALSQYATKNPNNSNAGGEVYSVHWQDFVFQWAFAATATTIPAGCVAERCNFNVYLAYSFFISAWVYPVVVHWVWSPFGWLGYGRVVEPKVAGSGFIDFAGSGVVHMVGGFSGMWGCILMGPRMGRFDSNGKPVEMPGHSPTLVVLGTVLLWFGWYGFNPGSMIFIHTVGYAMVVGRAAVCTTLSGAAGGIAGLIYGYIKGKSWDLLCVCNGVLCGFVSITCCCHVVEPWAAILCGFCASFIFEGVCVLFLKFKIDDPLSAAPMHGFAGMWGLFFTGLLAKQEYILQVYPGTHDDGTGNFNNYTAYPYGAFYYGGGGRLLAAQLVGICSIFAWVAGNMLPFFYIFKLMGSLRFSAARRSPTVTTACLGP